MPSFRQAVTAAAFVGTLIVNGAANVLPLNGRGTAEISDRFEVFVIPAGYVFSIWGLIYVLLGAFAVWQLLPRHRDHPLLERLGWLPLVSLVINDAWLFLFHWELFALTVPVMAALLLTLITIHLRLWAARHLLTGAARWTVRLPFSVYLGWITVATIANVAQAGQAIGITSGPIPPAVLAGVVLLVGLAIAARFVWEFGDVAYGLVITWAYVGIAVKEADAAPVPVVAALGAVGVALLAGAALAGRLTPARLRTSVP